MKFFVTVVQKIKHLFPTVKTYMIEDFFVICVLLAVAVISKNGYVEYLGVIAVFYTFKHAGIANRMEEAEEQRSLNNEPITVECYQKQTKFFYIKEILWLGYFIWLGAWSALVGVCMFLFYPVWRKTWRKYNPLKDTPSK